MKAREAPAPNAAAPLERSIKAQAYALGFDLCGITPLVPFERAALAYDRWVADGYAGEMAYMARNADKRRDPRLLFPGARSAVVVAMDYGGKQPTGAVARYARGDDYHEVMGERLDALHRWLEARVGGPVAGRAYVDTAPILERELARRAGLGWFGKNTTLINPRVGSYLFIASLFVDLELAEDQAFEADRCGSCRRCLDACPTDAFVGPHILDSRRCVSYLTIELRGPIPEPLREGVGDRVYGCDVCQDVCPWNVRFSTALPEQSPYSERRALGDRNARAVARQLLEMTPDAFAVAFRGSPMKRATLRVLKRNAAVVLGNVGTFDDVDALRGAVDDPDPLVREHAEWALARIGAAGA